MSVLIERALDLASKLLLAGMTALVFAAALSRTFGHPLIWSVDIAQLLFVWLCFAGAVKALLRRAHIGVDYFVAKTPTGFRRPLDLALAIVTVAFLATMSWFGFQLTFLNWQRVYGDSGISYAWVTIAVPIGCTALALVLVAQIVQALRDGRMVFAAAPSEPDQLAHQEL